MYFSVFASSVIIVAAGAGLLSPCVVPALGLRFHIPELLSDALFFWWRLLGQRHFLRQPQDSSQEIVEMTRSISAEEPARALRELYIQARYQPDAAITGAQVRMARQLLRKLREDPEKK